MITPLLSVITNIGYDHQQFLGDTLELIAGEKAGIIKPGIPAVIGRKQPETTQVFVSKANDEQAPLLFAEDAVVIEGDQVRMRSQDTFYFQTDLLGNYQKENIRTALAALEQLDFDDFELSGEVIKRGLSRVRKNTAFIGRFQQIGEYPRIICDSAHNVDGLRTLWQELEQIPFEKMHIVFGTVSDKDVTPILDLLPHSAKYYLAKADIPRGKDAKELKVEFDEQGFQADAYNSVLEAFEAAKQHADSKDLILVTGSVFVVAEVI